jgi:hypothetical protein
MAGKKEEPEGKRGRDAKTGRFVDQDTVKRRPATTINETIKPKPKPRGK